MDLFDLQATLTLDSTQYEKGISDAKGETDGLKTSSVAFGQLAAAAVEKVVSAFGNLLSTTVEVAATMETAFAQLETISGSESIDALTASLMDLSSETGVAADELAVTAYNAISAGVSAENAAEMVETASKLATAGFTDTDSALSVLTTAINAYGLAEEDAVSISDSLVQVQNLGVTTISQLASSMGKAISTASAYNVDLGNLESSYVSLTKAGISTEESTTYLSSMLNELGDTGSDVAGIISDKTGKSFSELMDEGYSLGDVMEILYEACDEDATALMNLWSSAEAGKASNAIVSQGLEEFNENLEAITNSSGATEAAYETMADTAEYSFTRMQTSMTNLQGTIGDDLNPVLATLADGVSAIVNTLTDLISETPAVTALIVAFGAALLVAAGVVVTMNVIIPKLTAAITQLGIAAGSNPFGLFAAAIAGVVAAVATFSTILAANTEKTESNYEAAKELTEQIEEEREAYEELSEELDEESDYTEQLMEELKDLADVSDKSAAEQERMAALVDELNELVPDLALAYDEEADSLNMTTEELNAYLDAASEQSAYAADVEYMNTLYDEQAELEAELKAAQEELTAATEEYNQKNQELIETGTYVDGCMDSYQQRINDCNAAIAELESQQESLDSELDTAVEKINVYAAAQEAEADTTDTIIETSYAEMISAVEELNTAYAEAYDSALESIQGQMELWDEVAEVTATDIADISENITKQKEYWEEYADNLENLNNRNIEGLDELVAAIDDGSTEAASYIAGLAAAGDDEIEELIETYGGLIDEQERVASTTADMAAQYTEQMDGLVEATAEEVAELNLSDEALEAAKNTLQGYVEGLSDTDGLVGAVTSVGDTIIDKFCEVLGINSPSTVMVEVGGYLTEGLMEGIADMPEQLSGTLQEALSRLILWGTELVLNAQTAANQTLTQFMAFIEQLPAQLLAQLTMALNNVKSFTSSFLLNMKTAASNTITQFMSVISTLPSRMMTLLNTVMTKVTNWGSSLVSKFTSIGKNVIQGLINGISSMVGKLYSSIYNALSGLVDKAKSALGIASPSKVFAEIGGYMAEGLDEGWSNEIEGVKNSITDSLNFNTVSVDAASTGFGSLIGKLGNAGNGVNVVQNIYSQKQTAADIFKEARWQQERAVLRGV